MSNEGIIRNSLKIEAAIKNARVYLDLKEQTANFDEYIWQFTDGKTIQNAWKTMKQVPASTKESDRMSKDLKKCGFKFVGTTICYAYMQSIGMVNDHLVDCFRYKEIKSAT